MNRITKISTIILLIALLLNTCGCEKKSNSDFYGKEDSANTGYGKKEKSSLYIDDFYFLTVGTKKATVEVLLGSAHYHTNNDELSPVYTLENGDKIAITYDAKEKKVEKAEYTYTQDMESESFFDILVELGILSSAAQEKTEQNNTDIQDTHNQETLSPDSPTVSDPNNEEIIIQPTTQGEIFASGAYVYSLLEEFIKPGALRADIISKVGKPNYFFSRDFKTDSYIIDCYNLSDGSKLYLDYGYERNSLRCAAIFKNGTVSSILDTTWSEQKMPSGFTRPASDAARINRLTKNMTPAKVYAYLGEPSWYEGTRAVYTDVFKLSDGTFAYLNFGSAHNKLTSVSIKGTDGTTKVLKLS